MFPLRNNRAPNGTVVFETVVFVVFVGNAEQTDGRPEQLYPAIIWQLIHPA
jgi:hypothetical protein